MKNNNVILKINLNDVTSAYDVYKMFALNKFRTFLSQIEQEIIATKAVEEFVKEYKTFIVIDECESCNLNKESSSKKKPNFFKRFWNKLFKKSSK